MHSVKTVFEPRISRADGNLETLVGFTNSSGGVFQCKATNEGGDSTVYLTMPNTEELDRAFSAMTETPHAEDGGDNLDEPDDIAVAGEAVPDYDEGDQHEEPDEVGYGDDFEAEEPADSYEEEPFEEDEFAEAFGDKWRKKRLSRQIDDLGSHERIERGLRDGADNYVARTNDKETDRAETPDQKRHNRRLSGGTKGGGRRQQRRDALKADGNLDAIKGRIAGKKRKIAAIRDRQFDAEQRRTNEALGDKIRINRLGRDIERDRADAADFKNRAKFSKDLRRDVLNTYAPHYVQADEPGYNAGEADHPNHDKYLKVKSLTRSATDSTKLHDKASIRADKRDSRKDRLVKRNQTPPNDGYYDDDFEKVFEDSMHAASNRAEANRQKAIKKAKALMKQTGCSAAKAGLEFDLLKGDIEKLKLHEDSMHAASNRAEANRQKAIKKAKALMKQTGCSAAKAGLEFDLLKGDIEKLKLHEDSFPFLNRLNELKGNDSKTPKQLRELNDLSAKYRIHRKSVLEAAAKDIVHKLQANEGLMAAIEAKPLKSMTRAELEKEYGDLASDKKTLHGSRRRKIAKMLKTQNESTDTYIVTLKDSDGEQSTATITAQSEGEARRSAKEKFRNLEILSISQNIGEDKNAEVPVTIEGNADEESVEEVECEIEQDHKNRKRGKTVFESYTDPYIEAKEAESELFSHSKDFSTLNIAVKKLKSRETPVLKITAAKSDSALALKAQWAVGDIWRIQGSMKTGDDRKSIKTQADLGDLLGKLQAIIHALNAVDEEVSANSVSAGGIAMPDSAAPRLLDRMARRRDLPEFVTLKPHGITGGPFG